MADDRGGILALENTQFEVVPWKKSVLRDIKHKHYKQDRATNLVIFEALTAFETQPNDDADTVTTNTAPFQVGTPDGGHEVSVEGLEIASNPLKKYQQEQLLHDRRFESATFSGYTTFIDVEYSENDIEAKEVWVLEKGTCSKTGSWSPEDQSTRTMTFRAKLRKQIGRYLVV